MDIKQFRLNKSMDTTHTLETKGMNLFDHLFHLYALHLGQIIYWLNSLARNHFIIYYCQVLLTRTDGRSRSLGGQTRYRDAADA